MESIGSIARTVIAILAGVLLRLGGSPADAHALDGGLRIYAVNVIKTPPFEKPFIGYGIYLGGGLVITAAHVVGHWPSVTHPTVRVAGKDVPTQLIKEGSFQRTDLALLSVDETRLPVSLRTRHNRLCTTMPFVGMEVIDVLPKHKSRARVISPLSIAPNLRDRFNTLIDSPEESGSGIFDAQRRYLLGIMSAKMPKYIYQFRNGAIVAKPNGFAGYFVPASKISAFIPANFRF